MGTKSTKTHVSVKKCYGTVVAKVVVFLLMTNNSIQRGKSISKLHIISMRVPLADLRAFYMVLDQGNKL